jgi:hypothetical protein
MVMRLIGLGGLSDQPETNWLGSRNRASVLRSRGA